MNCSRNNYNNSKKKNFQQRYYSKENMPIQEQTTKKPPSSSKNSYCMLLDESSSSSDDDDDDDDDEESDVEMEVTPYVDPWSKLSENEFMLIMMYLNPADCLTIACTSKAGNILVKYGIMWRQYLKRHFKDRPSFKANIKDWKRCYALSINNILDNMKCFYTKKSWHEDNTILGWGLKYTVNPRTSKVDYISSELDVLSYTAYKRNGIRKSVWNENFQLFLPIYISKAHFNRAMEIFKSLFVKLTAGIQYGKCKCCDNVSLHCMNKTVTSTANDNDNNDNNNSNNNSQTLKKAPLRSNENNWRSQHNRPQISRFEKYSSSKYPNSRVRSFKAMKSPKHQVFHPNMILTVFPKIMNTFVTQLSRSVEKTSSTRLINGYTSIFRTFVAFIDEYPTLKISIERYLNRFVNEPESRTKNNYQSLGELWPLLAVCPSVDIIAFNRAYFEESLTRSVLWIFRDAPFLANKKDDEMDQDVLSTMFLKGRATSNTHHMINLIFITSICRPNVVNANVDIADLISNYDWLCGTVPQKSVTLMKQQLAQCIKIGKKTKSWYIYLRFVGINDASNKEETKRFMREMVKNAIQESLRKGYHAYDTDFARIHKNGTSRLLQGEKYNLDTRSRITVNNTWRFNSNQIAFLDASMLFFNFDGELTGHLDYQSTDVFQGAATHSGDLMNDHESKGTHHIRLNLRHIPSNVHAMYLVTSVWANETMKDIKHPSVKCIDNSNDNSSHGSFGRRRYNARNNNKYENDNSNNMPSELCRFELNTDFADNQNVKNVIMCRIYRKYENSGWIFNAIGKNGLNGNAIDYAPIVEEIASILKKELKEYNKYQ